ncbi:hypothetical protein NL676_018941 [Syzygium grande]|nr:hypothetical protein NL676_018941 [Syzygium grande]
MKLNRFCRPIYDPFMQLRDGIRRAYWVTVGQLEEEPPSARELMEDGSRTGFGRRNDVADKEFKATVHAMVVDTVRLRSSAFVVLTMQANRGSTRGFN